MLPIIFIHNQNSGYLPLSLWQARRSNPEAEVILIGDEESRHFSFMVRHVHRKDYFKGAAELAKKFRNFSTNPHDFELICLQRWFILEEFMLQNGIEKCLYLDSDILLCSPIEDDAQRFSSFGMTVAGISGHSNFVQDVGVLTDFCNTIRNAYESPEAIARLEEKYFEFRKTHEAGGISDMTFFVEYRHQHPDRILDIGQPFQQRMYDITMTYFPEMENQNGIKKVRMGKDGFVYVHHYSERAIRMQTLHFQGASKSVMKAHIFNRSFALEILYRLNLGILFWQKVKRKLFS